ncbi:MAG: type III-A CRISPR-associated RAMP protein Csm5 [Desulfovibrionaceae bacterium]|nr:type III-A CRISPR-associated RAMP protein Csm5 [Desulfovibrionaceae bacterium]
MADRSPYQSRSFLGRTKPRLWTRDGFIPFRLEVLTPVTIGSGDDISPLAYVIRNDNNNFTLHLVDTSAWLLASQGKTDISAALENGDILRLRTLMNDLLDEKLYSLESVPIAQPGTAQKLIKQIGNRNSLSKAEVQPFIRTASNIVAYVPGSSLKGAINTALIDYLDHGDLKRASQYNKYGYTKQLEEMFGKINDHAMQALKVADIPIPPGATRIVSAAEVRLEPNKQGTPKIPCEALTPSKDVLYGRLFMETSTGSPQITLPSGEKIPFQKLSSICFGFYRQRFEAEFAKFYKLTHLSHIGKALLPIQQRIDEINPEQEMLLRVGHYSHIECVTVTDNAPVNKKGFGKTRTIADSKIPFGWVILSLCTDEEYRHGLKNVEDAIQSAAVRREQAKIARESEMLKAREEQMKLAQAAAEAKAKAEEERRRKEQEAAEREAKFANLSPEERSIAEVAAPEATEAQSMALFAQLTKLDADLQKKAAEALCTCWKRLGKWDGKLSKKQKEKVSAVKAILGK